MTREEAIEVLENGSWWDELYEFYSIVNKKGMNDLADAIDLACAALRAQQEADNAIHQP